MHRPTGALAGSLTLAAFLLTGCGGSPGEEASIPDHPSGVVQAVIAGLEEHRPVVLWRALPPSYREDVESLSADFSVNMDPILFERLVVVARHGVVVLQGKKELILASQSARDSGMDPATLDEAWEHAVLAVDAVLASNLARLQAYPSLDVEELLESTGSTVMRHLTALSPDERLAEIAGATVETIEESGDNAMVRVSTTSGKSKELAMIRVEGQWIPTALAEMWPEAVARARERIAFLGSDEAAQLKVQMLFALGMVEGFLNQIAKLEEPGDLDDLIGGMLGKIMPPSQDGHPGRES
jgi:hypothetical protein